MTKPTVFNYADHEELKRDYQELIEVNKSLREEIRGLKKKIVNYQIKVRILEDMRNQPPERGSTCSEMPNKSDSISRERALNIIDKLIKRGAEDGVYVRINDVFAGLESLPSADRPTGEWIPHPEISRGETWLCSECGEKTTSSVIGKPRYKYCPMCGAYMEEGGRGRCRG